MTDDPKDSPINDFDPDYFYKWMQKLKNFLKSPQLREQLAKANWNGSAVLFGPKRERIWREIVTSGEIKDPLRTEGFNGDMNGDISFEEFFALADQIEAAEAKQKKLLSDGPEAGSAPGHRSRSIVHTHRSRLSHSAIPLRNQRRRLHSLPT